MTVDVRVYLVTDPAYADLEQLVGEAVAGGATCVQVRDKHADSARRTSLAASLRAALPSVVAVIVDDDVDAARAGDGLHVGLDDLRPSEARALLGPDAVIGLTTGTLELVRDANSVADAIDYVGAGPFRATPTKDSGRAPLGVAGYPALVAESAVPVVAIGDVTVDDAAALAGTGVDGVALVRALMGAPDTVRT